MLSLLFCFLIGIRHALKADHVASLVSFSSNKSNTLKQGAIWGLGHAIILFLLVGLMHDMAGSSRIDYSDIAYHPITANRTTLSTVLWHRLHNRYGSPFSGYCHSPALFLQRIDMVV